jgi:hypothetical protein
MSKPNVPEEIWLGSDEYSMWKDWKVNGWLFVATLISALSDVLFPHYVRQWHIALRVIVALVPFLALLFWVRSLSRWIQGMDELHRRITIAAILFTTSCTFFFVVMWHRLDKAGLFQTVFPGGRADASFDIATVGHVFLLMTFSYFFGYRLFSRRFR